jgi:hypothetical protein
LLKPDDEVMVIFWPSRNEGVIDAEYTDVEEKKSD